MSLGGLSALVRVCAVAADDAAMQAGVAAPGKIPGQFTMHLNMGSPAFDRT